MTARGFRFALLNSTLLKTRPFPLPLLAGGPQPALRVQNAHHRLRAQPRFRNARPHAHRCPQILGNTQKGQDVWKLFIRTPPYFQKMHLFVIDITAASKETVPISFSSKEGAKGEEMVLEISSSELKRALKNGHRYRWVLIPEGSADIYIESEEIFSYQHTFPNAK